MKDKKIYLILILLLLTVFVVFNNIIDNKINKMIANKYQSVACEMKEQAQILIDEKVNATTTIAMALAEDDGLKNAMINDDFSSVDLHKFSKRLNTHSEFKNVWFQLVSNRGISKYRSWTKKRGDSLLKARLDVQEMIKKPRMMSTISTGKFDMTIKCLVPIYKDKKFLGSIEIITHFNSIYLNLLKKDIQSVLLVDKRYKKQITKAFTKHFIGDYYVALLHTKKDFIDHITKKGVEYFINMDQAYIVSKESRQLFTLLKIPDITGKDMGYFILCKSLDNIDMGAIKNSKTADLSILFIIIVLLVIVVYYILNKQHIAEVKKTNKVLKKTLDKVDKEKNKTREILDSLPNLVVLSNGREMMEVSKSVLDFFSQYESLKDLKKVHPCICDFFLAIEDEMYITTKEIDGSTWLEYILNSGKKGFKACMKKADIEHHFLINVRRTNVVINDDQMIVVSFTDITSEIDLAKENKIKDTVLYQQSKQAAMGNMIGMIAHQWKQPLAGIGMVVNNIKLDIALEDSIKTEDLSKYLDSISESISYMNTTIEDFRNFFKSDKVKSVTTLETVCDESLRLLSHSLKVHGINVVKRYEVKKEIAVLDNELKQIVLNLLNNAKDVLKDQSGEKTIEIELCELEDSFLIKICDNGGGIPEEIINNLGSMYFSTKEDGTGLGLYMSIMILKQQLNGTLQWYNTKEGACFEINLSKEDLVIS